MQPRQQSKMVELSNAHKNHEKKILALARSLAFLSLLLPILESGDKAGEGSNYPYSLKTSTDVQIALMFTSILLDEIRTWLKFVSRKHEDVDRTDQEANKDLTTTLITSLFAFGFGVSLGVTGSVFSTNNIKDPLGKILRGAAAPITASILSIGEGGIEDNKKKSDAKKSKEKIQKLEQMILRRLGPEESSQNTNLSNHPASLFVNRHEVERIDNSLQASAAQTSKTPPTGISSYNS
jgi:hypothetical protein